MLRIPGRTGRYNQQGANKHQPTGSSAPSYRVVHNGDPVVVDGNPVIYTP